MKPIKAKYTEIVLLLARVLPWLFPKWLRYTAKSYSHKEEESINHLYEKENKIKTASLLDGDFNWKAISVVVKIDHEDLDSIRRWLKASASPGNYNPERDDSTFKNSYDNSGGGYRSLGWIHFHKKDRLGSLARMELETAFCDSCYATISMYSYGVSYLSLYFFLKDAATEMVSKVDVSKVKRYYSFSSINPFSPQFRAIQHHDKIHLIEDLINENINSVSADVTSSAISVLNYWGVKKDQSDLELIADFYRNTDEAYFIEGGEPLEENEYTYISRRNNGFFDEKLSSDSSDNFLSRHLVEKNDLDAIFIKSKSIESFNQFDDFSKNGLTLHDSHIFISMLMNVSKQYKSISEFANKALLNSFNKIENNYDILFKSSNDLDSLKENIQAIEKATIHSCITSYADKAREIAKYRLKLANELKESIDRRLLGLNSEMQVENLRFNRRYSLLVGVLIVVQIILASLTIDLERFSDEFTDKAMKLDGKEQVEELAKKIKPNVVPQELDRKRQDKNLTEQSKLIAAPQKLVSKEEVKEVTENNKLITLPQELDTNRQDKDLTEQSKPIVIPQKLVSKAKVKDVTEQNKLITSPQGLDSKGQEKRAS